MRARKKILGFAVSAMLIVSLNLSCVFVAAGGYHTVGLRSDRTVVAVGANDYGQCNVGGWTDIWWVAAGGYHTVGVKDDGTVVAVGANDYGQCNVGGWTDIGFVAAGGYHTVGVKEDGTVVAVGRNDYGQCNVEGWTDIGFVAAGYHHTVGVEEDGIVVAVGNNDYGQCNVGGWTDMEFVAAGGCHTVGLEEDGTVVAVGRNDYGQCDVEAWTDINFVAAGFYHTVGVREDGTVVAVGHNDYGQCYFGEWTDISFVAAGFYHTVGLKSDGTVVAVGDNRDGQCDIDDWELLIEYDLTITSSERGSVTARYTYGYGAWPPEYTLEIGPGETGTMSDIPAGTEVELVAEAERGYRFVNWAGDVDTIGGIFAAQTTIVMEGDYEITARFAQVLDSKTEEVENDTVDARTTADTEVIVSGAATVRVDRYAEDPVGYTPGGLIPPGFVGSPGSPGGPVSLGKYIDVYVPDTQDATEIEIRLYYTAAELTAADVKEDSLRLYSGRRVEASVSPFETVTVLTWIQCSDTGVNLADGYIWAKIRADTTPSLADLGGTPFGGYGSSPGVPNGCGCFISTAVYGTDAADEIDVLRDFRDAVLLPNGLGASFVSFYYRISPPVAEYISRYEIVRALVRVALVDRVVAALTWSQDRWWTGSC